MKTNIVSLSPVSCLPFNNRSFNFTPQSMPVSPLLSLWLLSPLWMPIFHYGFFLEREGDHLPCLRDACVCVCLS